MRLRTSAQIGLGTAEQTYRKKREEDFVSLDSRPSMAGAPERPLRRWDRIKHGHPKVATKNRGASKQNPPSENRGEEAAIADDKVSNMPRGNIRHRLALFRRKLAMKSMSSYSSSTEPASSLPKNKNKESSNGALSARSKDDESSSASPSNSCSRGRSSYHSCRQDDWSEDSLLSSSSDDEESSLDSDYIGLQRIVKRFEMRDRMLNVIVMGKRNSHREMLLANELASRDLTLRLYQQHLVCDSKLSVAETDTPIAGAQSSDSTILVNLRRHLLFESYAAEGIWCMMWSCVGHAAFYDWHFWVFQSLVAWAEVDEGLFHAILLVVSIILMRANGSIWCCLGSNSYRVIKFEMHNREKLKYRDAQYLRIVRKHKRWTLVNAVLDLVLFYWFYIAIGFFRGLLLEALEGAMTSWYMELEREVNATFAKTDHHTTFASTPEYCATMKSLISPHLQSLVHSGCVDKDWKQLLILMQSGFAVLSILLMGAAGTNFFTSE